MSKNRYREHSSDISMLTNYMYDQKYISFILRSYYVYYTVQIFFETTFNYNNLM